MLSEGVTFTSTPEIRFEYSNLGYALLGRIITNVSKQPYADTIANTLLRRWHGSSGFDAEAAPRERRALGYRWEDDAWRIEPTLGPGVFAQWATADECDRLCEMGGIPAVRVAAA